MFKKVTIIGGAIVALAMMLLVVSNIFADSNNPGIVSSATYNSTTKTVVVTAHSNCTKSQPMGIAFFAVYNAGNRPAGDSFDLDIPNASNGPPVTSIDVLK